MRCTISPTRSHRCSTAAAPATQDGRHDPWYHVRPTLSRSAVWERGTDPMTRLQLTGGYDDYGRPHASADIGVPRGRDPRQPGRTMPRHPHHHRLRHPRRPRPVPDRPGLPAPPATNAPTTAPGPFSASPRPRSPARPPPACAASSSPTTMGQHSPGLTPASSATTDCRSAPNTWSSPRTMLAGACQPGRGGTGMASPAVPARRRQPRPGWLACRVPGRLPAGDHRRPRLPAARTSATSGTPTAAPTPPATTPRPAGAATTCKPRKPAPPPRGLITVARDGYGGDTATGYDPYQLLPAVGHRPGRADHHRRLRLPAAETEPGHRPERQPHRDRLHPARAARLHRPARQGRRPTKVTPSTSRASATTTS